MHDTIVKIGNSIIQHGKENNRIYLMNYDTADSSTILEKLNNLAKEQRYTKIFAKVPLMQAMAFIEDGYIIEAEIPNFFNNNETCYFLGKYLSMSRKLDKNKAQDSSIQMIAIEKAKDFELNSLKSSISISMLEEKNAQDMANIYKIVFSSYPFPIQNADYIKSTMAKNIVYFGLFENSKLIALSSAELDLNAQNAEMTDFATLPEYKGFNYSIHLLSQMEEVLLHYGIKTVYTIARANSPSMNITFARSNYSFGGKLLNNTQIGGQIENMNVWYKSI